jgi:16S rRNA (cytosine967-C5)-methyltransferase
MKFDNLLRYAVRMLAAYKGETPLAGWLKNFFRDNPQMGSRDRKQVSEMVYCFFRLGHSLKNISPEERIKAGLFLCNPLPEPILEYLNPEWHAQTQRPLEEKLSILHGKYPDFDPLEIFPWKNKLSEGVDHRSYCLSFLEKPRLFIRIRPGQEAALNAKLKDQSLDFQNADPAGELPFKTYSFAGGTKLDNLFLLNREAVIQDLSSQRTALLLKPNGKKEFEAWDCCAGSGGKSILLADLFPGCHLTVSDIRETILKNLTARFAEADIRPTHLFQADLTDQNDLPRQHFNFILADLPCTGSGTWSRSPEALYYFDPQTISNYRQRQEKILSNINTRLKTGGTLVYITCSVFADENEKMVEDLLESGSLKLEQQELLSGYQKQADSMFVGRFVKIR